MVKVSTNSPWCREEGQEHDPEYIHLDGGPICQPLREWVKATMRGALGDPERGTSSNKVLATHYERQMAEDWECFHYQRCRRCGKKLQFVIYADECPDAVDSRT